MKLLFFRFFSFIFILIAALGIWLIFSPALMNADSVVQYQQALTGNFDDWHPPIMSIIVHYIFRIGGNIASVTLLQILLGFIGTYLLIKTFLKYLWFLDRYRIETCSIVIFLILISPISAFSYYMVSFIKDTWLAICLIWTSYFALSLLSLSKHFYLKFTFLILSMVVAILVRHNALVLMPIFFILLYRISLKSPLMFQNYWINRSVCALLAFSPLFLFLLFNSLIYSVYDVKKTYPVDQVIAMESLGSVVESPGLKSELNYLSEHLIPGYKEAYLPGNVAPVMKWGPIKAIDKDFDIHSEKLRKEYFLLYAKAPFTLMKVKWDGFFSMLFPEYRYWFHPQLDANSYGLKLNDQYREIRNFLINFSQYVYSNPFLSLFFGEHFVWFFMTIFFLAWMIFQKNITGMFFILLIPLFYYLSYFIAATGPQFRFMFPATLLVQIVILCYLFTYSKHKFLKLF